jgi:hypothetical protein
MALFEYDINRNRNKTDAKSRENAFFDWLNAQGLGLEGFVPSVSTDLIWKGKKLTFFVESYGHFQVEGGWMVYLTYKADYCNHVRYHTWRWVGGRSDLSSHKMNEYINI